MEIGEIQKAIDSFNVCFNIGANVTYYPGRYEDDTIIHRNGKRTYTKTKAFAKGNTVVVFLDGIGNCDVRNVVSGWGACSLDSTCFDKNFEHKW